MITYTGQSHKGKPVYIIREAKTKSFPVWAGVIIILLVIGFAFLALWLRSEETPKEPKEPKEKEKPKTHGLDNRSYEDLTGEEFLGLPPDDI